MFSFSPDILIKPSFLFWKCLMSPKYEPKLFFSLNGQFQAEAPFSWFNFGQLLYYIRRRTACPTPNLPPIIFHKLHCKGVHILLSQTAKHIIVVHNLWKGDYNSVQLHWVSLFDKNRQVLYRRYLQYIHRYSLRWRLRNLLMVVSCAQCWSLPHYQVEKKRKEKN